MRLREHVAIQPGALDIFRADPRHLVEQEGYNVRDLTTPEAQEKLRELADSIAEVGVTDPLVVRFDGERIIVVEGHRRLMATMMAIEAGAEIKSVPIYQEARGVNDAQRDLGLIVSNSGEPLTPLEKAKVIGRLVAHGWSHQEIAKKCGWKSVGSVNNYLDMLGLPEAVKEQVSAGDLSATTARQIVKETAKDAKNDPEFAAKLIAANKEENAKIKGKDKSHRVTAKTLKRGKADKLPIPPRAQRQSELAEQTTKPEMVSDSADREPDAETAAPMPCAEAQSDSMAQMPTLVDVREAERTSYERSRAALAPSALAATSNNNPHPRGFKPLIEAIKPLAKAVTDFDSELPDDAVIFISDHGQEINAGQCRMAWKAWNAATGGSSEAEAA